jgi:DNA-directed RNA polymerase III subunit RPC2
VKRVLEHVADAHRARHRRQRSAESGGRGSGSNSNSNSPSHSRHGSFRDLSLMDTRSGSPSDGDGDFGGGRTKTTSGVSSRKPSVEHAEYFDGWVGSEDEDAPDVAIDHDWWAGLNIDEDSDDDPDHNPERFEAYYVDPKTEDYEGSRHGGVGVSSANAFLPSGKMPARGVAVDGSSRVSYEDDHDGPNANGRANGDTVHVKPDLMDAMERGAVPSPGDATSASAAKGAARAARMVEMPVPDVNARRTVNTYDPDSQRLVSVWAANYTVLMTDLVPVRMSDGTEKFPTEAVEAMFADLFPDEFRGIIPVYDHRPVDRLLDQRDELLNVLNKQTEKQRRSYQTTYTKRDWRVMTSVDAARADLEQCERAVVLAREAVLAGEPGPSCFAVFATQKAAAEAAQCLLHSGSRRNFRVQPAPGPDNVNWQTLLYRRHQSLTRIAFISPLIAFILLFPSGIFTVGIASACMGDVPSSLDWYCSEDAKGFKIFVSGLLPPILLTLWEVFVVSFFLMYCVQAQNVHASLSSTDRRFLRYYYVWGFANVLLGGVTGGALTSFAQDVLGQDNTTYSIQKHLGRILPISSNFFLVFVFFRSVYLPIQRLILPHPGIICWAVRRYLCVFGCAVTPRDRTVKYSPRGLRMGREVGVFLMVAMLGLTFCLTAPMMAPACLLFFVANFVVWRYHVLYVYERGWESNGSMWFTVVELVVWSLLAAQSFTSCVLFSKSAYLEGIALYLTIPYYLYKYVVSVKAEFGSGNSWSVPLGEAAKAPPADFSAEIYTHPSLRPAAMGWHPDVGKVWRGYPGVAVKHTL